MSGHLPSRRYLVQQFLARPARFGVPMSIDEFTPASLRRTGIK